MGKANVTSNNWLKLLFNATAIANVADNAATSPITNISVALHTADPGATGTQSTNETSYTGYARINVARTTGGWTASSAQSTSPVAAISFGACTAGTATITHFSVGKTSGSGATDIFYSGTVTPNISVSSGVTPQLTTATAITEA
jgi:hypothetical protein